MPVDRNPSFGSLFLALVAVGLVAGAAVLPWWSFDSSTGRKTPAGGPQDPSDTRVERHSRDFGPFWQRGDEQPSDANGAQQGVFVLGVAFAVAAAGLGLQVIGELWRFLAGFPRWLSLGSAATGVLALAFGLVWSAFVLPATMSGNGVDRTFTDELLDPGYIRTTLAIGWVAAALGIVAILGSAGFRFQAGAQDASAVEAYA